MQSAKRVSRESCVRAFQAAMPVWAVVLLAFAAASSSAQVYTRSYLPSAYGTAAFVGNTALVGPTAAVSLAGNCGTSYEPLSASGTAAGVNVAPLVTGGAANTSATDGFQQAQSQATSANINLLGGLISAQQIQAVSTTTLDDNGDFQVSAAGSTLSNLVILGRRYNGTVAPNTRINLPLLGYVVLNEQIPTITSTNAVLTVNMVHVYITLPNLLGLQTGTQVIISSATAGMYNVQAAGLISGSSYGTQVSNGLLASSPSAYDVLPCLGTNGAVLAETQASITLPGVLTTGTLADTVQADATYSSASGENTSAVQNVNLLSGLVVASAIRAQVDGSIDQYSNISLSGTDSYVGLSIAGHPEITDDVPEDTTIPILGLGTLYLKRKIYTPWPNPTLEIRSLELVINQINIYGLPVGADIVIGDAVISVLQPYIVS